MEKRVRKRRRSKPKRLFFCTLSIIAIGLISITMAIAALLSNNTQFTINPRATIATNDAQQLVINSPLFPIAIERPTKLVVFWHISLMGNHWQYIVDRQLKRIHRSGLYESIHRLYITLLGADMATINYAIDNYFRPKTNAYKYGNDSFDTSKFTILTYDESGFKKWERLALEYLYFYCHSQQSIDDNTAVLYLHAKGVARNHHTWALWLEYWLIDHYRQCTEMGLGTNYDLCGVNFYNFWEPLTGGGAPLRAYFPGNFWWASCRYIRKRNDSVHDVWRWQTRGIYGETWVADVIWPNSSQYTVKDLHFIDANPDWHNKSFHPTEYYPGDGYVKQWWWIEYQHFMAGHWKPPQFSH